MTRRTKILATLGPATDSIEKIQAIIAAGANTVRMNFSHGQAEDHIERAKRVREAAKNLFSILRLIKKKGYSSIAVSKIPNQGMGLAINDRLKRASKK